MLNNSETGMGTSMILDDVYKMVFFFSGITITCFFIWGIFGRKTRLVSMIIFVELLLFFLNFQMQVAHDCFKQMDLLIRAGVNGQILCEYLRSYFYTVFVLSALSLYKLSLLVILLVKEKAVKPKGSRNVVIKEKSATNPPSCQTSSLVVSP